MIILAKTIHVNIWYCMLQLFYVIHHIYSLHSLHFQLKPELKVVTNAPAITIEEVAPVAVSDAMLLAPEEVQEKTPETKGDSEKTVTDRKHERRLKKKKQRMRAKEKEKHRKVVGKVKPGLGNKYSKKAAMERLEKETKSGNVSIVKEASGSERTLTTSSAFFSRLQDEVKEQLKTKKDSKKKKKKNEGLRAPQLKL